MLYDLSNRIRAFGEKRRLNVGTVAKPRWIDNVHAGDDYAATYGNDNVYAVQPGTVIFSGHSSTYGWHVQVRLNRSIVIRYHSLAAKSPLAYGAAVRVGDFIGLTGKSASGASGNHVHIQAEDDGKPINPRPYISGAVFGELPSPAGNNSKPIPAEQEEDDMYSDQDRAIAAETVTLLKEVVRLLGNQNNPVLVKTARSNKVWLSDLVNRRLVASEAELANIKSSLTSRSLSSTVNVVDGLAPFGVPVLTDEQKKTLTKAQIDGNA